MSEDDFNDLVEYYTDRKKSGMTWRMDSMQASQAVRDILDLVDMVKSLRSEIEPLKKKQEGEGLNL